MKKVKIKMLNLSKNLYNPNLYLSKLLNSSSEFEFVEENEDFILTGIFSYPLDYKKYTNKKILFFWMENLYYPFNNNKLYQKLLTAIYIHLDKMIGKNFLFDKVRSILPKLNCIPYSSFITDIIKHPNIFSIVPNNIKYKNRIFNYPFFFDCFLEQFKSLIEVKKKNLYIEEKKKFCAFVVANPNAKDRIDFFKKLSKYKKVDSWVKVCSNITIPDYLNKKHKSNFCSLNQELFREYKFVICFENSYANDYVTEKLPNVMMANSIGIYRGAPNIGEFFNTKSFINFDDYGNDEAMIKKIIELDQDDEKYQKMLQEPFFVNNEIPLRLKTAKEDLKNFILSIIE